MWEYLISDLLAPLFKVVMQAILFPLGWPVVKLLTLGRYPVKGTWFSDSRQETVTAMIGMAAALVVMMALLGQFTQN